MHETTKVSIKGIYRFIERKVTKFKSYAKVDCLNEFLGKGVYIVITRHEE